MLLKSKRVIIFLLITLMLSSCATLFKGSNENVDFSSEPVGADVYINGTLAGRTPVKIELQSKNTYTIEFKKEGYETKSYILNNSVGAGWVVLNVLAGVVPIIVDAATGSWYNLNQKNVNMVLEKQKSN